MCSVAVVKLLAMREIVRSLLLRCDALLSADIKHASLRLASHLAQSVGPGRRRGLGEGAKRDALDRRY